MTNTVRLLVSCGLLTALAVGFLLAQDRTGQKSRPDADKKVKDEPKPKADPKAPKRAEDEKAIRQQSADFLRAFEKGDAKALADFWTDEGEYVSDDGTTLRGRKAIETAYKKAFTKHPKLKVEGRIDSIRFLSRDTAVEEGYVRVQKGKPEQPTSARYSILHVREGERWRIAVVREWPDEGIALRDLDWLIGTWTAKAEDREVRVVYDWDESKKFIRARITIKEDERTITATQVIGKDPRNGSLRSWLFESDGGFGEATWSWDGKRWLIEATGVQADGSEMTATNILTRLDKDSFTWQSTERTLDDEELSNLPPIKVTRVK